MRKRIEKELQVKLNQKLLNTDKFSLIKSRRHGPNQPDGFYRLTKPRKRNVNDNTKHTCSLVKNEILLNGSKENISINLKNFKIISEKINERELSKLFPDHFRKTLRIVLDPVDGRKGMSPCASKRICDGNESRCKFNLKPQDLDKLRLKLKAVKTNYTRSRINTPNSQQTKNINEEGFPTVIKDVPLLTDITCLSCPSVERGSTEQKSPLPPVLEREQIEEPYVYIENDLDETEEGLSTIGHPRDGVYERTQSDEDKNNSSLMTSIDEVGTTIVDKDESLANCMTLEVFVFQDEIEPGHNEDTVYEAEVTAFVKEEPMVKEEFSVNEEEDRLDDDRSMPSFPICKDNFVVPSPNLYLPINQTIPSLNDQARTSRDVRTKSDGYDSDATVAYSEDDEEQDNHETYKAKTKGMKMMTSENNEALKIRRTDQLFKFQGKIMKQIQDRSPKEISHSDTRTDIDTVFKTPSKISRTRSVPKQNNKPSNRPTSTKLTSSPRRRRNTKHEAEGEEQSFTLRIITNPKALPELKKTQTNANKVLPEESDFGNLISEPDRKQNRKIKSSPDRKRKADKRRDVKNKTIKVKLPMPPNKRNDPVASSIESLLSMQKKKVQTGEYDLYIATVMLPFSCYFVPFSMPCKVSMRSVQFSINLICQLLKYMNNVLYFKRRYS